MNSDARTRYQPLAWLALFSDDPAEKEAARMALDELDRVTAELNAIRRRARYVGEY